VKNEIFLQIVIELTIFLFYRHHNKVEENSKVISKYRLAANYGRERKAKCGEKFSGCSISYLELVQELNYYLFSSSKSDSNSQKHFLTNLMRALFSL
jgi:hypothetical protein